MSKKGKKNSLRKATCLSEPEKYTWIVGKGCYSHTKKSSSPKKQTSLKKKKSSSKKKSPKKKQSPKGNIVFFTRTGKNNKLYKYILSERILPKNLYIHNNEVLGLGSYGTVLNGTYNKEPVAVKFVILDSYIPSNDCGSLDDIVDCSRFKTKEFKQEIKDSLFGSKIGISPRILYSDIIKLERLRMNQVHFLLQRK